MNEKTKQFHPKRPVRKFNGPALLVSMMREVDPVFRQQLMQKLVVVEPTLAQLIEQQMVQFIDILRVSQQSLPKLLQAIPEAILLQAWPIALGSVRERLLSGLSERRREDFLAAVKDRKKIPKSQAMKAHLTIGQTLAKLVAQGAVKLEARKLLRELASSRAIKEKLRRRRSN